jgi:hypothetical protein
MTPVDLHCTRSPEYFSQRADRHIILARWRMEILQRSTYEEYVQGGIGGRPSRSLAVVSLCFELPDPAKSLGSQLSAVKGVD